MSITFISDLLYCFTCHTLARMREYGLGGDLFQDVWVVALELAGDVLQLVLQVHRDILAGSFPRRKLTFTDYLLCARSLDFQLVSHNNSMREVLLTLFYR